VGIAKEPFMTHKELKFDILSKWLFRFQRRGELRSKGQYPISYISHKYVGSFIKWLKSNEKFRRWLFAIFLLFCSHGLFSLYFISIYFMRFLYIICPFFTPVAHVFVFTFPFVLFCYYYCCVLFRWICIFEHVQKFTPTHTHTVKTKPKTQKK